MAMLGTQHYAGVHATKTNFNFERIALILSSSASASLTIEVFGYYKFSITGSVEPIQWRPLEFQITYYRFEAPKPLLNYDINFKVSSYLNIGTTSISISEQAKFITTRSISQYIKTAAASYPLIQPLSSMVYGGGSRTDSFWKFSLIPQYFPDFGTSKYYGTQVLYNWWLLGKNTF